MVSHFGNRRRREEPADLDIEMQALVHVGENACGQERISAQREEVIMDPDPFDLEDLCPECGQLLLQRGPWRDEGLRHGMAREPQLSCQADTLHFARRAFWELPNDEYLARDLEVGDAPDRELAKCC